MQQTSSLSLRSSTRGVHVTLQLAWSPPSRGVALRSMATAWASGVSRLKAVTEKPRAATARMATRAQSRVTTLASQVRASARQPSARARRRITPFVDRIKELMVPAEFYDVKEEVSPKAPMPILYCAAIVGWVAVLTLFIILFLVDYNHTTTLQKTHISGGRCPG